MIITHEDKFGKEEWLAAGRPDKIATRSTGTDHIDVSFLERQGVKVFSLLDDREALSEIRASSEWTFAMILLGLRRAHQFLDGLYRGEPGHELYGRHIGVVGAGRIGSNVMRWCAAFGATVVWHDPYRAGYSVALNELFAMSDVVCICCSLTSETAHMVNYDLLKLMRRDALLVNTARGAVINEMDLVEFLKERPDVTLAADVWEGELEGKRPLFWGLPNAVFSPHIAGNTVESNQKALQIAERLLED